MAPFSTFLMSPIMPTQEAAEFEVDHITGRLSFKSQSRVASLPTSIPTQADIETGIHIAMAPKLDLQENMIYLLFPDLVALDLIHGQWIVLSCPEKQRAIQVALLEASDATHAALDESTASRHRTGWVSVLTFYNLCPARGPDISRRPSMSVATFTQLVPCFPVARHVVLGLITVPGLSDLQDADIENALKKHFAAGPRRLLFAGDLFRLPLSPLLAAKSILFRSERVSPYLLFQVLSIKGQEGEPGGANEHETFGGGYCVDMALQTSLSLSSRWIRYTQGVKKWPHLAPLYQPTEEGALFEQAYSELHATLMALVRPATCSVIALPGSMGADSISDYQKDLGRLCGSLALRLGYHLFVLSIDPQSGWQELVQKMKTQDLTFGPCFFLVKVPVEARPASLKGLLELLERELASSFVLVVYASDQGLPTCDLKGTLGPERWLTMPRLECSVSLLKRLLCSLSNATVDATLCEMRPVLRKVKGYALSTIEKWTLKALRGSRSSSRASSTLASFDLSWLESCIASSSLLSSSSSSSSSSVPNVQWSDIGGLDPGLRETIHRRIELPLTYPSLYRSTGSSTYGHSVTGLLLTGGPGTGKTLLAKALATTLQLHFFSVKGPELLNAYVGESERHVRLLFQRAKEASPSLIFFDELDALASMRGNSGSGGESGATDRVVSQLFAEMDGLSSSISSDGHGLVFLVAATNRPDLLDPAFFRPGRFAQRFEFRAAETQSQVHDILSALTRKFTLSPSVDLLALSQSLARPITGAQLYALCSDAALSALSRLVDAQERHDAEQGGELESIESSHDNDPSSAIEHPKLIVTLQDFKCQTSL